MPTRIYEFRELLEFLTGQDWLEIDDLDSDSGRDYYYVTEEEDSEAFIRVDDDQLKIVVDDETVFDGKIDDDQVRVFINRRQPAAAAGD